MSTVKLLKRYLDVLLEEPAPPDPRALGLAALENDDLGAAAGYLAEAHAADVHDFEVLVALANVNIRLGAFAEAVVLVHRAIERRPADGELRYMLGEALRARGDRDGAAAAFQGAIDRASDHTDAHIQLGILRLEDGRHAEAIALFDRALMLDRKALVARFYLAKACVALGDFRRAFAQLHLLRQVRADYLPAYLLAAEVAEALGDRRQVVAELTRAVALAPADGTVQIRLGVAHRELGEDAAALACFMQAAALPASRCAGLAHAAVTCETLRRFERAAEAYTALLTAEGYAAFAQRGLERVSRELEAIAAALAA